MLRRQAKVWIEASIVKHEMRNGVDYELTYTIKRGLPGNKDETIRTVYDYPAAVESLAHAHEDATNILKILVAGGPVVIREMDVRSERPAQPSEA